MRMHLPYRVSATLPTAVIVVLATIMLDACGPGYGSSTPLTPTSAQSQQAATPSPSPSANSAATSPQPDARVLANPGATPAHGANVATTASDSVQRAQASLAADGDQVTPVMSYAPGETAQTQASNGNDSSSSAMPSH
ncbi:hypothetical protein VSR34_04805 [Paraburkholderia sp. JHI2823]|uniref:hypothetical protein n=1 Tax=Paraburkholderia TaxID=1822464 RepID=UPI0012DDB862|nr:hypothetical protein [Paraburkholderia mimosarum]